MESQMFCDVYDQNQVDNVLKPFYPDFREILQEGFKSYLKTRPDYDFMPIRTRADLIRSKSLSLFKSRYCKNNPGIKFIWSHDKDLFLLLVQDIIALRLKKLNKRRRANFNKTPASQNYAQQLTLDLPEHVAPKVNLVLGYEPDETWTKIAGIYIHHPKLCWAYLVPQDLIKPKDSEDSDGIVALPTEPKPPMKPRIRVKKKAQGNDANRI